MTHPCLRNCVISRCIRVHFWFCRGRRHLTVCFLCFLFRIREAHFWLCCHRDICQFVFCVVWNVEFISVLSFMSTFASVLFCCWTHMKGCAYVFFLWYSKRISGFVASVDICECAFVLFAERVCRRFSCLVSSDLLHFWHRVFLCRVSC